MSLMHIRNHCVAWTRKNCCWQFLHLSTLIFWNGNNVKPVSLNTWQFRYQSLKLVYALEHLLRARRSEPKKNDALSNLINGLGLLGTTYNFPNVLFRALFLDSKLGYDLRYIFKEIMKNGDQFHKSRFHSWTVLGRFRRVSYIYVIPQFCIQKTHYCNWCNNFLHIICIEHTALNLINS